MVLAALCIGTRTSHGFCTVAIQPERLRNRGALHLLHGGLERHHPTFLGKHELRSERRGVRGKAQGLRSRGSRVGLGHHNPDLPSANHPNLDSVLGLLAKSSLEPEL